MIRLIVALMGFAVIMAVGILAIMVLWFIIGVPLLALFAAVFTG